MSTRRLAASRDGVAPAGLRRRHWLLGGGAAALLGGGAAALQAGGAGWLAGLGARAGLVPPGVPDLPPAEVCIVAPPHPYEPRSGLPARSARPVPAHARCPVCGMFPARNPRWAAQVIHGDGAAHFLDSPLSLHRFLQDLPRYSPGRQRAGLLAQWVTDFDRGVWIDATTAFHVHGCDALGPMRAGNLPAFASPAAAQRLADARGGRVLPAAAITPALLRQIGVPGRHAHG